METMTKAALGAVTGALGVDTGSKGPSTIKLEGGAAKSARAEQATQHTPTKR